MIPEPMLVLFAFNAVLATAAVADVSKRNRLAWAGLGCLGWAVLGFFGNVDPADRRVVSARAASEDPKRCNVIPIPSLIIFSIITALAASAVADVANRNRFAWGVIGFFGSSLAVILVWCLPARSFDESAQRDQRPGGRAKRSSPGNGSAVSRVMISPASGSGCSGMPSAIRPAASL